MRLLVLTSNAVRHAYVANRLAALSGDTLVITECRPLDGETAGLSEPLRAHFALRRNTEETWFAGHQAFRAHTIPVSYGEASSPTVARAVEAFRPDVAVVFGASLIRQPTLSRLPQGRTVNLHLGLSPYYRGSGTNFWPFVNDELEYVGATLLHLDAGIDTGPIIAHVRPGIKSGDTVHTAGCRVIAASADALRRLLQMVRAGGLLPGIPQWPVAERRYYRDRDCTDRVLEAYRRNLARDVVGRFLSRPEPTVRLVPLPLEDPAAAARHLEVSAP